MVVTHPAKLAPFLTYRRAVKSSRFNYEYNWLSLARLGFLSMGFIRVILVDSSENINKDIFIWIVCGTFHKGAPVVGCRFLYKGWFLFLNSALCVTRVRFSASIIVFFRGMCARCMLGGKTWSVKPWSNVHILLIIDPFIEAINSCGIQDYKVFPIITRSLWFGSLVTSLQSYENNMKLFAHAAMCET